MNLLFYDLMLLFYNVLSGLIVKHFVVFIYEKFCINYNLFVSQTHQFFICSTDKIVAILLSISSAVSHIYR